MKGIILAGGAGTRLHPATLAVSKQLLPVYDKPMIYYPLSILMLSDIREILIISTPQDLENYEKLFGDGKALGIQIKYAKQEKPNGLAEAFIIGEEFIGDDDVCLILGDNIFYGAGLQNALADARNQVLNERKAVIFGYYVDNPSSFGVVDFDDNLNVLSIQEKPASPKSNYAVVGLYFYPNEVIGVAKGVKPSERGELEITSVNQLFLKEQNLTIQILGRGYAWIDTGTHDSLSEASEFVKAVEKRTSLKIACVEEIAYRMKFISKTDLLKSIKRLGSNNYTDYIKNIF